MQPLRRMAVDAAILFSDIMVPLAAVGVPVRIEPGVGPVVDEPIRTAADVARLRPLEPETDVPHVLEAIRLLRKELDVPLLGFAGRAVHAGELPRRGRPVADARADEGADARGARDVGRADGRARRDRAAASSRAGRRPARRRCRCSTRGSARSARTTTSDRVFPHMRRLFDGLADLGVPTIHFGVGTGELLALMRRAGGDVIGVDWRTPLDVAWERVGTDRGRAGQPRSGGAVGAVGGRGGESRSRCWRARPARDGHIFNLGHGVPPNTDPDTLRAARRPGPRADRTTEAPR